MTPISITIPESLSTQKTELETALAGIANEEKRLAEQRKDIQAALSRIATCIAVLSGQPAPTNKGTVGTTRKPMSPEARENIRQGLLRSKAAKAVAAQVPVPAPPALVEAPADTSKPDVPTKSRAARKAKRG